ncbi:hypothetical protein MNB_SUP05-5-341 [hydrothermal vent metagenome]|uniref:Transglycosylase SLT domain-containing protein n=1 Tax=hydrothermal vent metagenome TaxID=652676 RepID=A0A1W1BNL3_9ZZZZ
MKFLFLFIIFLIQGCFSTPKIQADDICEVLDEKVSWFQSVDQSEKKWDVDKSLILAFIHQESRFESNALPPKDSFFGLFRSSSAYGFAQVKEKTWEWYQVKTNHHNAKRNEFSDVVDFIGWYVNKSSQRLKINNNDVVKQYLAYHEGQGGYEQKTYQQKPWLIRVAKKVKRRADLYKKQLKTCEAQLSKNTPWSFF